METTAMGEIALIMLTVIAFASGAGLAAVHKGRTRHATALARKLPDPRSMPATQTADVQAKAGRDPAARL